MVDFARVRRWFTGAKPPQRGETGDTDLARFFTDAEEPRSRFERLVSADAPERPIVVVYGDSGVGKSSLLKMYRLYCHGGKTPVALVNAADAPSPIDLLERWTRDLAADGVDMPGFSARLERYRKLQAKVDDATGVVKAGAKVVTALGSQIPGVGMAIAAAGPDAVEGALTIAQRIQTSSDYELYYRADS